MSIKPRRPVLARGDDRVIVHAALFLMCAIFSALGMGAGALWCYFPAAVILELLSQVAPLRRISRKM